MESNHHTEWVLQRFEKVGFLKNAKELTPEKFLHRFADYIHADRIDMSIIRDVLFTPDVQTIDYIQTPEELVKKLSARLDSNINDPQSQDEIARYVKVMNGILAIFICLSVRQLSKTINYPID